MLWQQSVALCVRRCRYQSGQSAAATHNQVGVFWAVLSLHKHMSQTNIFCVLKCCCLPVYVWLIRAVLVRIRIAKCFTKTSRRFRCELMFENEHIFCSWISMLAPAQLLRNWRDQRPSSLVTRVTLTRTSRAGLGDLYAGVDRLLSYFCYCSTWRLYFGSCLMVRSVF
jgi:hypothetical protein